MTMPTVVKRVLFRTHWILGIIAGLVLAVVGVTGAMLSFEEEIVDALSPHLTVVPAGEALAPDAIVARVRAAHPDRAIAGYVWRGDDHAVDVRFDGRDAGSVAVNPYTGELLPEARGEGVLHFAEQLHRNLAAGPVGKQIVGASTVALIVLAISGLVLRWPRRWGSPRAWLRLDFKLKGRSFLWHLHAITGTWVVLFYLLASLTGLWWSYEFYRNAINQIAGVQQPQRGPGGGGPGGRGGPGAPPPPPPIAVSLDASWRELVAVAPGRQRAMVMFPRAAGQPIEWRYLDADAGHNRAFSTLRVAVDDGRVIAHERFADLPTGRRAVSAMLPLHTGGYFGVVGRIGMGVASLLMPLFTITGIWIWLKRRRAAQVAAVAGRALATLAPGDAPRGATAGTGDEVLVVHASQGGTAERLAWQTAQWLRDAGLVPRVKPLRHLDAPALAGAGHALFVVATYGEGDPPDTALDFARRQMRDEALPSFDRLRCAVLALGNRRYDDFCGFGKRFAAWLGHARAHFLFDLVEADENTGDDLVRWRENLARTWPAIGAYGDAEPPLVAERAADFATWRLATRRRVDPGDADAQRYELMLVPDDAAAASWQPGDALDLRIEPDAAHIAAWLGQWGLSADETVRVGDESLRLADALRRREPPRDPAALHGVPAQALVDRLAPLSARSYSIASLSSSGRVRLLARMTRDADGRAGLASAALSGGIADGGVVMARVHRSAGFTFPDATRPLVLVGNGVGIAPFLAALEARARDGGAPAWLLHGERTSAHAAHLRDELARWQHGGAIARLDHAYSREGTRRYVQDVLRAEADVLRDWLSRGATIMVCGSPAMGQGVETVLLDLLGADGVATLREQGRYRRELF